MRKLVENNFLLNYMDVTEQYLDKLYDDLQKEQMKLLQDIKTGCEKQKEKDNQKQFSYLNSLMITSLRLRNLKKTMRERMD